MTPTQIAQVRLLDRAERRWLADARDRLRRTRVEQGDPRATKAGAR